MNLYASLFKTFFAVSLLFCSCLANSGESESIVKPLQETEACRYKVWYLEICDPVEKVQVVHLILAEGGTNCEIVRHLTRECVPAKENDHPTMPQKAIFKNLLLSQNHSLAALEETINKTKPEELPSMLLPGSSKLKESEAELLQEIQEFERQEDKTLQNMEETMRMMSSTPLQTEPPTIVETTTKILEDSESDSVNEDLFDIEDLENEIFNKNVNDDGLKKMDQRQGQDQRPVQVLSSPQNEIDSPRDSKAESGQNLDSPSIIDMREERKDSQKWAQKGQNWTQTPNWVATRNQNWKETTTKDPNWKEEKIQNWKETTTKDPNWRETKNANWKNGPNWNWSEKKSPNWSSDLDPASIGEALNLTETLQSQLMAKNGSKIINWMIKNMPSGRQTIIVL